MLISEDVADLSSIKILIVLVGKRLDEVFVTKLKEALYAKRDIEESFKNA